MTDRKLWVTGLGFITCIGNDRKTVVENLKELRHGIILYPPFQDKGIPVKVAAPVKGFDTDSIDPEDWSYPGDYKIRLENLRAFSPHGLYAHCANGPSVERRGDCGGAGYRIP